MFFRRVVTRRGGKEYVYLKLIENYRQDGKIKQRVIANFGNIEHLTPEKVHSVVTGQSHTQQIKDLLNAFMGREEQISSPSLSDLTQLWNQLGVVGLLREELRDYSEATQLITPWLIESLVLQNVLHPVDQYPERMGYPDPAMVTNIPEPSGEDYYRAVNFLAGIQEKLLRHLFTKLAGTLGRPSMLCFLPIQAEFQGPEYEIAANGISETGTYHRPLDIVLIFFPPNIPFGLLMEPNDFGLLNPNRLKNQPGNEGIYLLLDAAKFPLPSQPDDLVHVASLPKEDFSGVPLGSADRWEAGAISQDGGFWIKDVVKPDARYIITNKLQDSNSLYDLRNLDQAEHDLKRLKAAVEHRKISRESTIMNKAHTILNNHACQEFFHCSFHPFDRTFEFKRLDKAIKKHQMLQRTHILKTTAWEKTAQDIVLAYREGANFRKAFRPIYDLVRIPPLKSQAELHYNNRFVAGQVLIHILGLLLKSQCQ